MNAINNRMSNILSPEDESSWIEPSNDNPESLEKLLFPLEDDSLEIYEVSRAVNNPINNDKYLILAA